MNIERAKIAIDKMASFIPEYVLNDLYKDHDATAEVLAQDENRVVFSIVYHDKKDKRILSITVKRNEINVHYNGTMQVFSHRIDDSFYNDVLNVLFEVKTAQPMQTVQSNSLTKECLAEEVEEVANTLLDIDTIIKNLEMQTRIQDDLIVKMSSVFESLRYINKMLNK